MNIINIALVSPIVKKAIVKAGHKKVIVEKKFYRQASYNEQLEMKTTSMINSYLRGVGCY